MIRWAIDVVLVTLTAGIIVATFISFPVLVARAVMGETYFATSEVDV